MYRLVGIVNLNGLVQLYLLIAPKVLKNTLEIMTIIIISIKINPTFSKIMLLAKTLLHFQIFFYYPSSVKSAATIKNKKNSLSKRLQSNCKSSKVIIP